MSWESVAALAAVVQALGVVVAVAALIVQSRAHRQTVEQTYALTGAQTAIAWRQQVLDLHDRGLTPAQIRAVFLLEDGGEGYERSHGRIDDVLGLLPPGTAPSPPAPASASPAITGCRWCRWRALGSAEDTGR